MSKVKNNVIVETTETVKAKVKELNKEAIKTSENLIDGAVATGEKWQDVMEKALKGGVKLMDKQQDITFSTLEAIKGQTINGGERFAKLVGLDKEDIENIKENISSVAEKVQYTAAKAQDTAMQVGKSARVAVQKQDLSILANTLKNVAAPITKEVENGVRDAKATLQNVVDNTKLKEVEAPVKKVVATTQAVKNKAIKTVKSKAAGVTEAVAKKTSKAAKTVAKKSETTGQKAAKEVAKAAEKTSKTAKTVAKKATTTAKKAKAANPAKDDLKTIEGIGPKIEGLMNDAGIFTFQELGAAKVETLKEILAKAGPRFKSHNPTTWNEQAVLAARGKMEELEKMQDKLNGGRPA